MILIDGNKYSCSECIRGHRSSSCRHHMRALLQVRSKGRPNFQFSPGNKNHRIAVFAEKVANAADESKDCKNVPVVILKTSDKHVIDISNGQIVGPYEGNTISFQASKPIVKADNFLNSSSCCSKGASRVRKSCQCNKEKVSKSKILKSYIDKKIKQQELGEAKCCSKKEPASPKPKSEGDSCCSAKNTSMPQPGKQIKLEPEDSGEVAGNTQYHPLQSPVSARKDQPFPNIGTNAFAPPHEMPLHPSGQAAPNLFVSNSNNDVFQVINVPNCSLPGTCSCSSDCACPNCMTHNNINAEAKNIHGLEFLSNDSQFESNLILTSNPQFRHDHTNHQQPNNISAAFQDMHASPLSFPNALNNAYNSYAPSLAPSADSDTYHDQTENNSSGLPTNRPEVQFEPQFMPLSNEELNNNPQFHSSYPTPLPKEYDYYNNILRQVIGSTIPAGDSPSNYPSEESSSSCACPDDNCGCNNCETHGIIDGYKLDDIFMSKTPLGEFQRNHGYRN